MARGLNRRTAGASFWRHWAVLAIGFLYMSLDETAQIHEMLIRPTRHQLGLGSLGMESVSALFLTRDGLASVSHGLATTAEEFLEMAGIVVFLKALLEYPLASGATEPA